MKHLRVFFGLIFFQAMPAFAYGKDGFSFDHHSPIFIIIIELLILGFYLLAIKLKKIIFHKRGANKPGGVRLYIPASTAIALSIGLGVFCSFAIPVYVDLFLEVSGRPGILLHINNIRHCFWILTAASVAGYFGPYPSMRTSAFFSSLCVVNVMVFVFLLWAIYKNIFVLCFVVTS